MLGSNAAAASSAGEVNDHQRKANNQKYPVALQADGENQNPDRYSQTSKSDETRNPKVQAGCSIADDGRPLQHEALAA